MCMFGYIALMYWRKRIIPVIIQFLSKGFLDNAGRIEIEFGSGYLFGTNGVKDSLHVSFFVRCKVNFFWEVLC